MSSIADETTTELTAFRIQNPKTQELLVEVFPDGRIKYGEQYDPDEAAKMLWEAIACNISAGFVRLVAAQIEDG